jgi:hypothetical protein
MSTVYEQRRQARLARLHQRAASTRQEAQQHQQAADAIARHIPLGQPILVGLLSERYHRRDLDRIHNRGEKSWQAQDTAAALDQRPRPLSPRMPSAHATLTSWQSCKQN